MGSDSDLTNAVAHVTVRSIPVSSGRLASEGIWKVPFQRWNWKDDRLSPGRRNSIGERGEHAPLHRKEQ